MQSQRDQTMSSPALVLGYRVAELGSATSGMTSSSKLNTAPSASASSRLRCCALQAAFWSVLASLPLRFVDSLPISSPRLRDDEEVREGVRKLPNDSGRETRGGVGETEGMGIEDGTYPRIVRENDSRVDGSLKHS